MKKQAFKVFITSMTLVAVVGLTPASSFETELSSDYEDDGGVCYRPVECQMNVSGNYYEG